MSAKAFHRGGNYAATLQKETIHERRQQHQLVVEEEKLEARIA